MDGGQPIPDPLGRFFGIAVLMGLPGGLFDLCFFVAYMVPHVAGLSVARLYPRLSFLALTPREWLSDCLMFSEVIR
jgi:hypothetical protein